MANPEHVALLKKSVEEWNKWREENPKTIPDLSKSKFIRISFPKANLNRANLEGADLSTSNFKNSAYLVLPKS